MLEGMPASAQVVFSGVSLPLVVLILQLVGLACFAYIVTKRVAPLLRGERDFRTDRPLLRFERVLKFWFGQWKHPRYKVAGTLHLFIFAGFLILTARAFYLLIFGLADDFVAPSAVGRLYDVVADCAATIVFLAVSVAAVRRVVFKPARYVVPKRYGKGHPVDAIFLLGLIALLMLSESLFEASRAAIQAQQGLTAEFLPVLSLGWLLRDAIGAASAATLWRLHFT